MATVCARLSHCVIMVWISRPVLIELRSMALLKMICESCEVRSSSVVALSEGTVGRMHEGGAGMKRQRRFLGSLSLAIPNNG